MAVETAPGIRGLCLDRRPRLKEKVHKSYLCRLLRLTLLSPSITESILDRTLPRNVILADLIDSQVVYWVEQEHITRRSKALDDKEEHPTR